MFQNMCILVLVPDTMDDKYKQVSGLNLKAPSRLHHKNLKMQLYLHS